MLYYTDLYLLTQLVALEDHARSLRSSGPIQRGNLDASRVPQLFDVADGAAIPAGGATGWSGTPFYGEFNGWFGDACEPLKGWLRRVNTGEYGLSQLAWIMLMIFKIVIWPTNWVFDGERLGYILVNYGWELGEAVDMNGEFMNHRFVRNRRFYGPRIERKVGLN